MPSVYDIQIARILALTNQTSAVLERRDDNDGDNGGLQTSTKIGIAIGIICFVTILTSFWFIWRWHRSRPPPTEEETFREETLDRWMNNLAGSNKKSRSSRVYSDSDPMRRASNSTFATFSTRGVSVQGGDEYELSQPAQAHISRQQ